MSSMDASRTYGQAFRTGLIVGAVSFLALTVTAAAVLWGLLIYSTSGSSGGQAEIRRFRVVPELLSNLVHVATEQYSHDSAATDKTADPSVLPHVQLVPASDADLNNHADGAEGADPSDTDSGKSTTTSCEMTALVPKCKQTQIVPTRHCNMFYGKQDADTIQAILDNPTHDDLAYVSAQTLSSTRHGEPVKDQEAPEAMDSPAVDHSQPQRDAGDETPSLFSLEYFDIRDAASEAMQVATADVDMDNDADVASHQPVSAAGDSSFDLDTGQTGAMQPGRAAVADRDQAADGQAQSDSHPNAQAGPQTIPMRPLVPQLGQNLKRDGEGNSVARQAQQAESDTYVKQLDWPPDSGISVEPEEAGVPHARDCAVCDRCLITERPGIRLDTIDTGLSDVSHARLRLLAAQRRSDANALPSSPIHSTARHGKQHTTHALVSDGPEAAESLGVSRLNLEGRALAGKEAKDTYWERAEPPHARLKYLLVDNDVRFPEHKHAHCPICQGCAYNLTDIVSLKTQFKGVDYAAAEGGSTNAHLFVTQHPESPTGQAVAKVYCMPQTKEGGRAPPCDQRVSDRVVSVSLPQEKLSKRCGFERVVPRMWTAPLNSLSPQGQFISWDALWMERAEGVSVAMLTQMAGSRDALKAREELGDVVFDELLVKTVKSEEVVLAAIWDLLTMQCDRHGQNVYVDAAGHVKLIDADQALGDGWRVCGVDSLFLPTTQKYMINLLGWQYVMKHPSKQPRDSPPPGKLSAQIALDYRCHAPGGAIGRHYPEQVKLCLSDISNMTYRQVQMEFGISKMSHAIRLHQRASDMAIRGFEWALQHGEPRNPWALQYPLTPPCCKLEVHLGGAKCLSDQPFTPWVQPKDTLSCGGPSNGKDPAPHIREHECRDITGKRRSGFWGKNETNADPMDHKRRVALGEWTLMQRDAFPRDLESVLKDPPTEAEQGSEQGLAGVWMEPVDEAFLGSYSNADELEGPLY